MEFGPELTEEERRILHDQRLQVRAHIRAHNSVRPRCAGCGYDMPVFDIERTVITSEQMTEPGWEYLPQADFRPGDLICFWCADALTGVGELYQWGKA